MSDKPDWVAEARRMADEYGATDLDKERALAVIEAADALAAAALSAFEGGCCCNEGSGHTCLGCQFHEALAAYRAARGAP